MAAKRGTKVDRYPTREDTHLRIDSSIVRISGEYYYVALNQDTRANNIVAWKITKDGLSPNQEEYSANDDRIDVSSFPLGFVNCDRSTVFVLRPPYRRQKQGVSAAVLNYATLDDPDRIQGCNLSLTSYQFARMLLNIYPDLEGVLATLKSSMYKSHAFSRNFAVYKNAGELEVFYQTNKVGKVKDSKTVIINPEYQFNSIMITELESLGVVVAYA